MVEPPPVDIDAALVDADAVVRLRWDRTRIARHEPRFPVNRWAGPWWHCGWIQYWDSFGWLTLNVWLDPETGERRIVEGGAPDGVAFDPNVKE